MAKWYNPTGNELWDDWYKFWGIIWGGFFLFVIVWYLALLTYKWYTAPCAELKKEMANFYAPARCISGPMKGKE